MSRRAPRLLALGSIALVSLGVGVAAGPGSGFGAFVLLAFVAEGLFWLTVFR